MSEERRKYDQLFKITLIVLSIINSLVLGWATAISNRVFINSNRLTAVETEVKTISVEILRRLERIENKIDEEK